MVPRAISDSVVETVLQNRSINRDLGLNEIESGLHANFSVLSLFYWRIIEPVQYTSKTDVDRDGHVGFVQRGFLDLATL